MSAPELLLARLNHALASIVTACDAVADGPINDKGETVEQALRPIMRRLLLSQTLGKYSLLAVAGTQGAGKTTLIKSLYDLKGEDAGWLKANEGRGEIYPILITEGDPAAPAEGLVWKLEKSGDRRTVVQRSLLDGTRTIDEAQQEFRRAVSERDTDELLVELRVPGQLRLGHRKGWLLLPGYEARTAENEAWQSTMRAALTGASGSIVVTDETRLARDQSDLICDAVKSALNNMKPVVVVTKTEHLRKDPVRLGALEMRAAEVFDVPLRRVQCIGISDDPGYIDTWREALKEKITQFITEAGGGTQEVRHAALDELVRRDLKRALADVNRHVRIALGAQSGADAQAETLRETLEIFDESAARLRKKYYKVVCEVMNRHTNKSKHYFRERIAGELEGIRNHISHFFDTDTGRLLRLQTVIAEADKQEDKRASELAAALAEPIRQVLTVSQRFGHLQEPEKLQVIGPTDDKQYEVVPWTGGGDVRQSASPSHALVTLFSPTGGPELGEKLFGLEEAVKMFPALALEWARVASQVPATRVDALTQGASVVDPIAYTLQALGPATENAQNLMKTVAQAMLAMDVASAGAGAAGAAVGGVLASPMVIAGTALLAVGYLATNMFQEVRTHDRANRDVGEAMLAGLCNARIQQYLDVYDDLMEKARDNLEQALRRRYRISDVLATRDRLVHAIALAKQFREELTEELNVVLDVSGSP